MIKFFDKTCVEARLSGHMGSEKYPDHEELGISKNAYTVQLCFKMGHNREECNEPLPGRVYEDDFSIELTREQVAKLRDAALAWAKDNPQEVAKS